MIAIAALTILSGAALQAKRALDASRPVGYHIAAGDTSSGYQTGDETLATWAFEAWKNASDGGFEIEPSPRDAALIQLYWATGREGLYGEVMPIRVGSRRGAAVFVRPDTETLGREIASRSKRDSLFRDTVVYLTCLHELGHAFGLPHTDDYDDIMYFFGFGGDIPRFFGRYRDKLQSRDDIRKHSGLSTSDVRKLHEIYPPNRRQ